MRNYVIAGAALAFLVRSEVLTLALLLAGLAAFLWVIVKAAEERGV